MKLYTTIMLSLIALSTASMYAVSKRDIALSNETSGKLATPVDVIIITTTGAFGRATAQADSDTKLTIYEQYEGDGIGKIAYLKITRLENNRPQITAFKASNITSNTNKTLEKFPNNATAKNNNKIKDLESLTFKYVGKKFTVEGDNDVKIFP